MHVCEMGGTRLIVGNQNVVQGKRLRRGRAAADLRHPTWMGVEPSIPAPVSESIWLGHRFGMFRSTNNDLPGG